MKYFKWSPVTLLLWQCVIVGYISSRKHSPKLFFSIMMVRGRWLCCYYVLLIIFVGFCSLRNLFISLCFRVLCVFFVVVVIAVAVSAAFSVFCNRMRECVRALSFGLLYVDLFNEFALFFETFHFNLFSTLLNCITYSFFYILSQVVFIVGFNEYFLFSLSNFFF